MSKLTDVVHFRGEKITLFATFKSVQALPNETPREVLDPKVSIRHVDGNGTVIEMLPPTPMARVSPDRCYLVYQIPDDAPLTTYVVTYTGVVDGVETYATEEFIISNPSITFAVGDPNITYNRATLRYGPHSHLQRARDRTVKKPITLPKGEL